MGAAGVLNSKYPVTGIPVSSAASGNITAGTAILGTPYVAQEQMTIDALGVYVGALGAGGTVRLGLYTPRATNPFRLTLSSIYADLLVEAPTAVDASTTGEKIIVLTTPIVIAAGAAIAGVVAVQGATVGLFGANNSGLSNSPWGHASGAIEGGPVIAATASGVTGALPSTFTPAAFRGAGLGGCLWFRRSA
jgi:hypothetical protein